MWVVYHIKLLKCGNEILGGRMPNRRKSLSQATLHGFLEDHCKAWFTNVNWSGVTDRSRSVQTSRGNVGMPKVRAPLVPIPERQRIVSEQCQVGVANTDSETMLRVGVAPRLVHWVAGKVSSERVIPLGRGV